MFSILTGFSSASLELNEGLSFSNDSTCTQMSFEKSDCDAHSKSQEEHHCHCHAGHFHVAILETHKLNSKLESGSDKLNYPKYQKNYIKDFLFEVDRPPIA